MLKNIAILLSILIVIIDILLYIKMGITWDKIGESSDQYESASLLLVAFFRYGILVWGILLIPLVWLEYFLITLLIKSYIKFEKFKRIFLSVMLLSAISIVLVFCIKVLLLVCVALMN